MSAQETNNMDWTHHEQNTIDLTEDRHDHSLPHMRIALPPIPGERPADAPGSSSRTQRGPRFERNIINLDNSDEEDHTHRQMHHHTHDNPLPGQSTAQDEESLFIPDTASAYPPYAGVGAQRRPTTSGLRPGYMRNYPTAAERDEIQVVASRSLSRHPSRRSTPSLPRPYEAANNTGSATIDLTADDDDDVIHTSTRALPGINGDLPAMAGSGIGTRERPAFGIAHLAQMMRARGGSPGVFDRFGGLDAANTDDERARTLAHQRRAMEHFEQRRQHRLDLERQVGERNAQQAQDTIAQLRATGAAGRRYRHQQLRQAAMGVGLPAARNPLLINLDFGAAAFDMGLGEPARPATPKYEAPPPPEKGFTRSPEEDEEVVCPNCGDELGVSKDETKAQVWVVKGCGHVSCFCCKTLPSRTIKLTHLFQGLLRRMCHPQGVTCQQKGQGQSGRSQHPARHQEMRRGRLREECQQAVDPCLHEQLRTLPFSFTVTVSSTWRYLSVPSEPRQRQSQRQKGAWSFGGFLLGSYEHFFLWANGNGIIGIAFFKRGVMGNGGTIGTGQFFNRLRV